MSGYEGFAPVYDAWAADMTEDVDFYVELAREAEGPVVELAVGTGRISIPIAQRTGKRVIGHRPRRPRCSRVARRARRRGGRRARAARGRHARPRPRVEASDLVICPYRALLHLPTWADRRRVFERVARALRPGGRFAWNAFVFDHRYAAGVRRQVARRAAATSHRVRARPTTASTSRSRTGRRSRSGGSRAPSGKGSSTSPGLETEALYGWFDRRPVRRLEPRVRLGRAQAR